jgi:hypothetical protein
MATNGERREITLGPDDVEYTDAGELVVRSSRVQEALDSTGAARELRGAADDQTDSFEISVTISVSF